MRNFYSKKLITEEQKKDHIEKLTKDYEAYKAMLQKIKDVKCLILKETYLRIKIINDLRFMYIRYRKDIKHDYYKSYGSMIEQKDIDLLTKMKKEYLETQEEASKLLDEMEKEYYLEWDDIWKYGDDAFNEERDNAYQVMNIMKDNLAILLEYSYTDKLKQEFMYLYSDYVKNINDYCCWYK